VSTWSRRGLTRQPSSIDSSSRPAGSPSGWWLRLEREPDVEVAYSLEDGSSSLLVASTHTNRGETPIDVELVDAIRADATFEFSADEASDLFWAYDKHFGQAYGVVAEGRRVRSATSWQRLLRYAGKDGKVSVRLAPRESYRFTRRVIPGRTLFDVRGLAGRLSGKARKVTRFVENREVRIAQVLIGMACPRDPSMISDQAGRCNSMAQRSVAVFSCDPPLLDMLRHACSHSRHLVAQSFMISPCPFAHSSAQHRHASVQAWWA